MRGETLVVVGAGQAGQALAAKYRQLKPHSQIVLIGSEPVPPYQRPPLSKAYMLGEMPFARMLLRSEEWYADNRIQLRVGETVLAIDRKSRRIETTAGSIGYDCLALTTGVAPRRLPVEMDGELGNVFTLRNLADAESIAPLLQPGRRLLVIGGGYIGLEAAAIARRRGLSVVLLEASSRILQRVAAIETSILVKRKHLTEGVDVREGAMLRCLIGDRDVTGAELNDGSVIACDLVVVGIGVTPETGLAEAAGLEIINGIAVDAFCRTSDPNIYAAGDCASFPNGDVRLRLESVGNAIDMAVIAARNIAGQQVPYDPAPWFWSDQFDLKLQIAGLSSEHDRVAARNGGAGTSHWYFKGDRLIAVDAINDHQAFIVGKKLIRDGISPNIKAIQDSGHDLKLFLKTSAPSRSIWSRPGSRGRR